MKRILTLILVVLPFFIFAQDFRYGIKAGVNLSSYRGEGDGSLYRTDAHAGLFASYQFTNNIGLQTEILYSRQGSRDTLNGDKINTSLNYLNVQYFYKFD